MKYPFALSQISLALIWKRLTFPACSNRRCWYAIAFEQASAKEELGRGEAGRALPKSPNLPLLFFRRRLLVIFSTFPSPKRKACPQSRTQNHPNLQKFSNVCCGQSNSFPHRSVRLYLFTKIAEIQITLLFVCFFTNQNLKKAAITKHRQHNISLVFRR